MKISDLISETENKPPSPYESVLVLFDEAGVSRSSSEPIARKAREQTPLDVSDLPAILELAEGWHDRAIERDELRSKWRRLAQRASWMSMAFGIAWVITVYWALWLFHYAK